MGHVVWSRADLGSDVTCAVGVFVRVSVVLSCYREFPQASPERQCGLPRETVWSSPGGSLVLPGRQPGPPRETVWSSGQCKLWMRSVPISVTSRVTEFNVNSVCSPGAADA